MSLQYRWPVTARVASLTVVCAGLWSGDIATNQPACQGRWDLQDGVSGVVQWWYGGVQGADGQLIADGLKMYVSWLFSGDLRADITAAITPLAPTPDLHLTSDDLILFIRRFVAGCP